MAVNLISISLKMHINDLIKQSYSLSTGSETHPSHIIYKGMRMEFQKIGNIVNILFQGTTTEKINSNEPFLNLQTTFNGALKTIFQIDTLVTSPVVRVVCNGNELRFAGAIESNTPMRGCISFPIINFTEILP